MYATTTTGHREHVSVNKDSRVLQLMNISGNQCRLIQSTVTTTETWLGLSYADASSVCVASESSTLDNVTRNYLGSAKITFSSGGVSVWNTCDGCWGTKVTSQLSRMGDNNCYQVVRTTTEMEVSNVGGTLTLL